MKSPLFHKWVDFIDIAPITKYTQVPNKISNTQGSSPKIVSENDQEIPQSQTADNTIAPRGRAAQPSRDTRKTKDLGQFPIQSAQILTACG